MPFVVLVFVLALLGQSNQVLDMLDFLIVAAMLYGESFSKLSKLKGKDFEGGGRYIFLGI